MAVGIPPMRVEVPGQRHPSSYPPTEAAISPRSGPNGSSPPVLPCAAPGRGGSGSGTGLAASVEAMSRRVPGMVLTLLLLATGGGLVATDAATASPGATARKHAFRCHGLDRSDVRGVDPTYTR